jgi:hypothetical protein
LTAVSSPKLPMLNLRASRRLEGPIVTPMR